MAEAEIDGQLPEENSKYFLTLPGERVLIAKRKHIFMLLQSIFFTIFILLMPMVSGFLFLQFLFPDVILLPSLYTLFLMAVGVSLVTKNIVDWYYHFYVITNRKILEICSRPPFFHRISDVFLDQVRTTEVASRVSTILHEFLDMGDVVITFDRPSHEEGFVLYNIQNPREVCIFLGDSFEQMMHASPWFQAELKEKQNTENFIKFNEDVFPRKYPRLNWL